MLWVGSSLDDNINQLARDYYDGKRPFSEIFDYYTNSEELMEQLENYTGEVNIEKNEEKQGGKDESSC